VPTEGRHTRSFDRRIRRRDDPRCAWGQSALCRRGRTGRIRGIPSTKRENRVNRSYRLSVFVIVIAALNLVLDFDFIEQGVERGAPKHMEWYGAFGLLVTLVWLYLEILHLLAKLQSRQR